MSPPYTFLLYGPKLEASLYDFVHMDLQILLRNKEWHLYSHDFL